MTNFKKLPIVIISSVFVALGICDKSQAAVFNSTMTLGFEGVGNANPVGEFYNTAPQDFDIVFSPNALAAVDADAGGSGNFGNEPSPDTTLFFLNGAAATLNTLNGFDTGFSLVN